MLLQHTLSESFTEGISPEQRRARWHSIAADRERMGCNAVTAHMPGG